MHNEAGYAEKAIQAGAMGYLTKKEPIENVISAIREVMKGNLYVSSEMSEKLIIKLMKKDREAGDDNPLKSLTHRETEVLRLFGSGYTPQEIAEELQLSINTVEAHRKHLREKLGLSSSKELVKYAIRVFSRPAD